MIRTGTATQALVLLLLGYVLVAGEPGVVIGVLGAALWAWGLARHASVVLRAATARGPAVAVRALRQARSRAAVPRQHDPDAAGPHPFTSAVGTAPGGLTSRPSNGGAAAGMSSIPSPALSECSRVHFRALFRARSTLRGGAVLNFLYYPVSAVMWFWHQAFALVLGPSSGIAWALSVVFLVLTLRAIMIKPFLSQMRSGRKMRALAPQLAELRKKHAGDKQTLVAETQKLQREHGVSTLGGCLPVLIQMPVFLALLHVLRYFNRPGLTFEQNAAIGNYVFGPDEVRSFLEARLFGAPLSSWVSMPRDLLDSFGAHVDRWEVVAVAVPLMLLAAVATHITARGSLRQQRAQQAPEPGTQAAQMAGFMKLTPWIFPLGVIVGGLFFTFPIAILLYWLTNNGWTMVQQHLVHRSLDAQDARDAEVRSAARLEAATRPGDRPGPGAKPVAEGGRAGRRTAGQASEGVASNGAVTDAPASKDAASKDAAAKGAAAGGAAVGGGSAGGAPGRDGPAAVGGPAGSAGTAAEEGEPAAARSGPNGVAESAAAARRGGPAARRAGTSGKAAAGRRKPGTRKGGRH